jgi:tight adherence protein C
MVPISAAIRELAQQVAPLLPDDALVVHGTKGLERETLLRLSQVLSSELRPAHRGRVAVLSGPTHAEEVGRGIPTAAVEPPVAQLVRTALPLVGAALIPTSEEERTLLKTRLIHAGLYGRQAMPIFLGVKLILMVAPTLVGLVVAALGLRSVHASLLVGGYLSFVGMAGPRIWLGRRKTKRQSSFRRALPDVLDVLVICVEGGLSLAAALHRVASELRMAYPTMAAELFIVQREVNLGLSSGASLKQMGERTDLEEILTLASVITQAEKFGASLVASLRVHAATLRMQRKQHAEEQAQKAAIKILFPTLLFIFPAIFIVILGPAAIRIAGMFKAMQ